jgi:LacI family transcriptional regulator
MDSTIKDIARKVNVSYATVSRALNNKYGVKRETREKILRAAREVDYRPNAIARGLVKKQTHSIGLIIPDITNPFFPEVARGIEAGAQEAGYSIFLCNTSWDKGREMQYANLLSQKRVDGIIVAPVSPNVRAFEQALGGRIPVVYVSHAPKGTESSFVMIDNVRGGFLATQHLIETGRLPVGFIGAPEDSRALDERLEGYKRALRGHGLEVQERYIQFGDFRRETGYRIIQRMIDEKTQPRGVFGENDLLALGVMQGARERGLDIPDQLAVVGFDDIPLASFPEIQLSTISQPKYEMGRIAVEILLDRLHPGDTAQPPRRVVLEPELIIRRSG